MIKFLITYSLSLIILLVLFGCASPKEVYIPVPKKCYDEKIKIPQKPQLCVDNLKGDEKIDVILNCSLKDVNQLEVYSEQLEVMICK